ncbi:MAG: flagellar basal body rod protein FlgB [Deltaproteobacteria bacterium]|nr:flagellar basal body rod protein FlgB [Deltaproteobacteria bacterium]
MNLFGDAGFKVLERSLDLRIKRHALLTSNVANSETPGFKARELDFAGELEKAVGKQNESLAKTNPGHQDLASLQASHIVFDNSGAVGNDGNNVDLDINVGKLSSNAAGYNHAVNLLTMKLRILRDAASGRGV